MALTIHDPGHVALRRGIRAAVALPTGLAIALYVTDDVTGVLFTMFGIVGLLVNADFAGSTAERTASYLLTGVAGTVALAIGWLASFTTPTAVIATVVVAFLLSFVSLLRGTIALGTPAVLLVFVVAVSLEDTSGQLPSFVYGWWLAVVISLVSALLILPHNRRTEVRSAMAAAFTAAARSAERTWLTSTGPLSGDAGFADFAAAVERLDRTYGGQPFRTNGLTTRDQAMTLLIDHVNSARLLLAHPDDLTVGPEAIPVEARFDLVRAVVAALEDLSAAMTDARRLPSGQAIDDCRVRMTTAMEQWVLTESERGSAALSSRISADHRLRMAALLVEQMVELARVANGGDVESLDRRPPIPIRSRTQILRSQLHPQSPWLRNSLRSAFGLGVAVLVVNVTGVGHGFWVLIGVISILRYDAVGTRKFAAQAIVGTALGVVIATVVVLSVGQQEWILWVLLPPMVFLAAWSAVAVNYPVGQAAFSGLILVAFGIVAWPPQPTVGLVRIEDIALGAAVALVVGLLMWPRGAVGYLRRELASATRAGGSYLSTAIEAFSDPFPRDRLDHEHARAIDAAERASETYDIALMQRGPTEDLRPWTAATTTAYLLVAAGRVIAHFAETTRALAQHPELAACLAQAQRDSAAHWEAVAASIEANPHPVAVDEDTVHPLPDLAGIRSREDARALIIAVWVIDWVRHLDRLATGPAGSVEVLA